MHNMEPVSSFTAFKNLSYVVAFIVSAEWLGLNPLALSAFTMLMLLDVFTGVVRAALNEGGIHIRSAILKRGIVAKLLIILVIFSIALSGKILGMQIDGLIQGSIAVLTLGELYSIIGNVYSVKTGKPKVEIDAMSYILNRVKEMMANFIKT